jgi:hypothetical protein
MAKRNLLTVGIIVAGFIVELLAAESKATGL